MRGPLGQKEALGGGCAIYVSDNVSNTVPITSLILSIPTKNAAPTYKINAYITNSVRKTLLLKF